MPFKSLAQRKWMHANHPQMAKRWEAHTPKGKRLPKRKRKKVRNVLGEIVSNTFCPTGPGGGVDPSCSPREGGPTIGRELLVEKWTAGNQDEVRDDMGRLVEREGKTDHPALYRGIAAESASYKEGKVLSLPASSFSDKLAVAEESADMSAEMSGTGKVILVVPPGTLGYKIGSDPRDWNPFPEQREVVVKDRFRVRQVISRDERTYVYLTPLRKKVRNASSTRGAGRVGSKRDPSRTLTLRRALGRAVRGHYGLAKVRVVDAVLKGEHARVQGKVTANVFCPTGEGGGIDPTCSPGSVKAVTSIKEMVSVQFDKFKESLESGKYGDQGRETLATLDRKKFERNWNKTLKGKEADPSAVVEIQKAIDTAHREYDVPRSPIFVRKLTDEEKAIGENAHWDNGFMVISDDVMSEYRYRSSVKELSATNKTTVKEAYPDLVAGLIVHEYGHKYHDDNPETIQRATFILSSDRKDVSTRISSYAATHPKELVAEAYAMSKHPSYRSLPEPTRSLVERVIGATGLAANYDPVQLAAEEGRYDFGVKPPSVGRFLLSAYAKGLARGFVDVRNKRGEPWTPREREQFIRDRMRRQVRLTVLNGLVANAVPTIKAYAADLHERMEDVTKKSARDMARVLKEGFAADANAKQIARELVKRLDMEEAEAKRLARTELVRFQAEGQLDAMEALGEEEVEANVEWETADDPCPLCAPLRGVVFPIEQARNMIPRHPNCYCSWSPVPNKVDKRDLKRALRQSKKEAWEGDDWGPTGNQLMFDRLLNVFCPTGPGGGIDPTCPPEEGGGDELKTSGEYHEAIRAAGYNALELDKLDVHVLSLVHGELMRVKKEFPGIEKTMSSVRLGKLPKDVPFTYRVEENRGGQLIIDDKQLNGIALSRVDKLARSSQSNGWLASGNGVAGLLAHELAHAVDKTPFSKQQEWSSVSRMKAYIRQNPPTEKDLSKYGTKAGPYMKEERFAEAYAAMVTNPGRTRWQQGFDAAAKGSVANESFRSYFADCPRDERGRCLPGGSAAEVINAFCPTGEGGGVDPTCSPVDRGERVSNPLPRADHNVEVEVEAALRKDMGGESLKNYLAYAATEETVRIATLISPQSVNDPNSVAYFKNNPRLIESGKLPLVIQYGSLMFLRDGNSRAVAAKELGRDSIKARVVYIPPSMGGD